MVDDSVVDDSRVMGILGQAWVQIDTKGGVSSWWKLFWWPTGIEGRAPLHWYMGHKEYWAGAPEHQNVKVPVQWEVLCTG